MTEKTQLKTYLLSLFIISAMAFSQLADAALALVPQVDGYSSGRLKSSSGGHSMTAANDGYIKNTITNVGGKPITVPAKMRMAANAGNLAKIAMRLNPLLLAGTLALPYLIDAGMEYINGEWVVPNTANALGSASSGYPSCSCELTGCSGTEDQVRAVIQASAYGAWKCPTCEYHPWNASKSDVGWGPVGNWNYVRYGCSGTPNPARRPATDADWDALPNPLPAVGPELPFAPYMPEGAPVLAPEFDFTPFHVPLGSPYTRPDGSTVQPMAVVSPNREGITVDTYDKPLTDPAGQPVASPVPQDTTEPVPKEDPKTQCDKFPDTLGCAKLDTLTPEAINKEAVDIALISPVSVGGAGSCPAPMTASFLGQNVEVAFTPLCTFADTLRPLVLSLAWLSAGLIFIGGVRNG